MKQLFNAFYEEDKGDNPPAAADIKPEEKPEVVNKPKDNTPPPVVEEKKFTQAELNAINAKTKTKFLKELGFDSEEDYKKHLSDLEAKKPLEEKLKTLETKQNEALSRAEKAEARLSVLELGVPKEKVDRVVKLAQTYDGETIDAKIEAVLKDFPEFKTAGVKPFGNAIDGKAGKTKEQIEADQFRKGVFGD